jgi:hypothetical protein
MSVTGDDAPIPFLPRQKQSSKKFKLKPTPLRKGIESTVQRPALGSITPAKKRLQPLVPVLPLSHINSPDASLKAIPQPTKWSEVFHNKKISVLQIAEKNAKRIPMYKTILAQGGGTFGHGSLAKT